MNKEELLKLFSAEKLAEIIEKKDIELERLKERNKDLECIGKNLEYIGKVFINGKYYLFYIREE